MSFIPQGYPYTSPLEIACIKNHPQMALLLIKHGAIVNYKDGVCNDCHYCFYTFKECFPHRMITRQFTGHHGEATLKWSRYFYSLKPKSTLKAK